jgi:FkbM family methyltransferase
MVDPFFRRVLFSHGVAAAPEHRHIMAPELSTVVDIGCNRGQFSLAARRWVPGANVFAFEPLAGPAAVFCKVFADDNQIRFFQTAVGPQAGKTTIHVSGADDSSSLLPISGLQQRLYPGTGEVGTETIRVGRLSDFVTAEDIKAPSLLKLDVQGFELEALRGCEDLLDRFSQVYVECSFLELYTGQALAHEVIAWLAGRSFVLKGIYNMSYDIRGA